MDERLVTVQEAAKLLNASPDTIRRWIRRGKLTAILPGGDRLGYRIREEDVRRFINPSSSDELARRRQIDDKSPRTTKVIIRSASGQHVMMVNTGLDGIIELALEADNGTGMVANLYPAQVRELIQAIAGSATAATELEEQPEEGDGATGTPSAP